MENFCPPIPGIIREAGFMLLDIEGPLSEKKEVSLENLFLLI